MDWKFYESSKKKHKSIDEYFFREKGEAADES